MNKSKTKYYLTTKTLSFRITKKQANEIETELRQTHKLYSDKRETNCFIELFRTYNLENEYLMISEYKEK